jgi:hypothetical protein
MYESKYSVVQAGLTGNLHCVLPMVPNLNTWTQMTPYTGCPNAVETLLLLYSSVNWLASRRLLRSVTSMLP